MSGSSAVSGEREVRLGIVGAGRMGQRHARALLAGSVQGARLSAIADSDERALLDFAELPRFSEGSALFASGLVDAVIIATPHFSHAPLAIEALGRGLSVLTEKPIAAHKADAERMLRAYAERPFASQVFGACFNLRADPRYIALRELLSSGEFGRVRRIHWTSTDWFRSDAYYRSSAWRATWQGEGGGVLLNQCPHTLDLWQWLFGMPQKVRAFCGFGRFHPIEVEDAVTAYLEYDDGKNGIFVASTGEAPGTNRLEIVAERGRLLLENETLSVSRSAVSTSEFSKHSPAFGARLQHEQQSLNIPDGPDLLLSLLKNFVNALRHSEPLQAPAEEGIASLELANAMLLSSLREQTVSLPLDAADYESELQRLIRDSRARSQRIRECERG